MAVSANAARAYAYLVGKGFSPYAAAGMVGNLMAESGAGLNVGARNPRDPGTSEGIAQWNRERKAAMRSHRDPGARDELERQLSFLVKEMTVGPEKAAYRRLQAAKDITGGTAGGISYERPAGYTTANPAGGMHFNRRLANAQAVYRDQTGQNPTLGSAPSAVAGATGGGGDVTAPPPPPPDYAAQNLASGLDMLTGGTGVLDAAQTVTPSPTPPPSILSPEPQQAGPTIPQLAQGADQGDGQGSAASLMASLLDRKRQDRAGIPPGLLG